MSYADPRGWLLIMGAAAVFIGILVFRVHGVPRAFRAIPPNSSATGDAEARLRWLDQYSFIGMGLVVIGGLLFGAYLLTLR